VNRPSPRHKGVFQRCGPKCPPDRCRTHRWAYAVELPAANGPRRQVSKGGYETATAAAAARAEVVRQHHDGTLPADTKRTFGAWVLEWLAGKVERGELEDTTARGYRDVIENHLAPTIGYRKLAELRGIDLTRAYARIVRERAEQIEAAETKNAQYAAEAERVNAKRTTAGKVRMVAAKRCAVPRPISPATVQRIHAVVSGAFKSAVKAGLVTRNVAPDAELPKVERKKVRPPTPEAYGAFLDAIEADRLYPLFVVAGYSGLRRGELVGLRWADIDMATGRVVVAQQRVSVGYRVTERTTKTDAGQDRVVFLDAGTVAILKTWRAAQARERLAWGSAYTDGGYVFTHEDGQPLHPDAVTKRYARLARAHGLPTRLHALRHFRAAALISTGADIAAVSKMMGHASIAITSDLYGSLFDKASAEMAENAAGIVPRRGRRPA